MRVLADENIPRRLISALREAGHDVLSASDGLAASADAVILERARSQGRVLLTFDADFGRMIFSERHQAPPSVIYLRSPPPSPDETLRRVLRVLAADAPAIDGYFVSIASTSRFHPLPGRDSDA